MSSQSLPVIVAGTTKELVLETDPKSGRTAVRLDGRPVTRPLAATEEERDFSVGAQKFILRRLPDGRFDVDYAPPDLAAGGEWVAPTSRKIPAGTPRPKSGLVGSILGIAGLLLVGKLVVTPVRNTLLSSAPQVEVSRFRCEKISLRDFEASGAVKNLSKSPLVLTANVSLHSGQLPERFNGPVNPRPLPPGETGRFVIRTQYPELLMFQQGECRLDPFNDDAGERVNYRRPGTSG